VTWDEGEVEVVDFDDPSLGSALVFTKVNERAEPEPSTTQAEPEAPDPEVEDSFDVLRHDGGAAFELGIDYLERLGTLDFGEWANGCSIALGAYDYVTNTIGLNIDDLFRRWRELPVILMPIHVSNRYGASDKGALVHLLDDAVRAYVVGAPAAALAMCRAALKWY
jgi:hypothetical protein